MKLSEVIEAIDLPGREWRSFLNRDTGQIVTLTEDGIVIAEDEDFDRDALDDDEWLPLPDGFEVDEWGMMQRFARGRRARQQTELLDALDGRGAFRMFRSILERHRIEEDWVRYREHAFTEIATDWLQANRIAYDSTETVMDVAKLKEFGTGYTAAWCSQNAAGVAAFFAENGSLSINDGAPSVGRTAITAAAQGFMTAFPDMVVTMDSVSLDGHQDRQLGT